MAAIVANVGGVQGRTEGAFLFFIFFNLRTMTCCLLGKMLGITLSMQAYFLYCT